MPFWSLKSRAERVVVSVPAYAQFEIVSVSLADWRSRWLPGLQRDGSRAGLNWSGRTATGFDVEPGTVERNLAAREEAPDPHNAAIRALIRASVATRTDHELSAT